MKKFYRQNGHKIQKKISGNRGNSSPKTKKKNAFQVMLSSNLVIITNIQVISPSWISRLTHSTMLHFCNLLFIFSHTHTKSKYISFLSYLLRIVSSNVKFKNLNSHLMIHGKRNARIFTLSFRRKTNVFTIHSGNKMAQVPN